MPSSMKNKVLFFFAFLLPAIYSAAQQPFTEGMIKYKVMFENAERKKFTGFYTFTFKNGQIKKELTLSNGFQDIVLINTNNNTIYSLRGKNGKKYAIQLSMEEMTERQQPYKNFTFDHKEGKDKLIAGMKAEMAVLTYRNGQSTEIYYSDKWYADKAITYERFPGAHFLPLSYSYADDVKGFKMQMEVIEVSMTPVENSIFRIPADYRMISNEEYKEMNQ